MNKVVSQTYLVTLVDAEDAEKFQELIPPGTSLRMVSRSQPIYQLEMVKDSKLWNELTTATFVKEIKEAKTTVDSPTNSTNTKMSKTQSIRDNE